MEPKKPAKSTGPPQQQTIFTYQEVIDGLSQMLLDEDWDSLKSDSPLLSTVKSTLRDTIKALEKMEREGKEKNVDISSVIGAVRKAHIALTQALVLLSKRNIKYPQYLDNCRDYLNLASGLISGTQNRI